MPYALPCRMPRSGSPGACRLSGRSTISSILRDSRSMWACIRGRRPSRRSPRGWRDTRPARGPYRFPTASPFRRSSSPISPGGVMRRGIIRKAGFGKDRLFYIQTWKMTLLLLLILSLICGHNENIGSNRVIIGSCKLTRLPRFDIICTAKG